MSADCDLAIVGSGFAGTLLAMIARRLGRSVLMIERGRHPRFAIGESSTPLANLWLEILADRYDLPRLRPLSQWGTWQASHPHIGCGTPKPNGIGPGNINCINRIISQPNFGS